MFCRDCGKQIIGEAKFCPACGVKIIDTVQVQQKDAATASPASFMDFVNPLDGSTYKTNVDLKTLMGLNAECKDERDYESWIDNLGMDLHPLLKDVFKKLTKFTVTAGKVIFHMGKVILNIVMKIVTDFSHTIAGLVAGFIIGTIFSSIPIIGWALGPLMVPLFAAFGGIAGFITDMSRKIGDVNLENKIRSSVMKDFTSRFAF